MNRVLSFFFHIFTRRRFEFRNASYSQEGEDLFLIKYFGGKKGGYFIDVGAHHPKKLSNTYKFYMQGWQGLNIDAMPESMKVFDKVRPRDINLEIGVGEVQGEMTYFAFNEPALNTFSKEEAEIKKKMPKYRIIKEHRIAIQPLSRILDTHWVHPKIDFMSIDVEGLDFEVLRSNNWELYRPQIVLVEDLERNNLLELKKSQLVQFMDSKGYLPIGRTFSTLFFENQGNV